MKKLILSCLLAICSVPIWADCPDAYLRCFTVDNVGKCTPRIMGSAINTYDYGGTCVPNRNPSCERLRAACNATYSDFCKGQCQINIKPTHFFVGPFETCDFCREQ